MLTHIHFQRERDAFSCFQKTQQEKPYALIWKKISASLHRLSNGFENTKFKMTVLGTQQWEELWSQ